MPPAARTTDPTGHGNPLGPGPGSPDVMVGNMPAWRAVPTSVGGAIDAISSEMESFMSKPLLDPPGSASDLVKIAQKLIEGAAKAAAAGEPGAVGTAASQVVTLVTTNVSLTAAWTAACAVPGGKPAGDTAYTEGIKAAAAAAASATMSAMAGLADMHVCPIPTPIPPHGPGFVTKASASVMINNLPAARQGDKVMEACGGADPISMGEATVEIGDSGGGGGGGAPASTDDSATDDAVEDSQATSAENALIEAARAGTPLIELSQACQIIIPGTEEEASTFALRVVLDEDGTPVRNIELKIKLPDGTEESWLTDARGEVFIDDLEEPGVCDVSSHTLHPRLSQVYDFVGTGETPLQPEPLRARPQEGELGAAHFVRTIAEIEERKVRTGDTLESLAREVELTWQDLAQFNWGTAVPDEVNRHLRDEVGCTQRDARGNYRFSDADEPGVVLLPKKFELTGLATDVLHTLRIRPVTPEPQLLECVSIPGITFAFDKSFIRPWIVDFIQPVEAALQRYPNAQVLIYGHTDRVGSPTYNKSLSDRRAKSVYAFITDDTTIWEELYGQENWGLAVIQEILHDLGHDPGPFDGLMGTRTQAAMDAFSGSPNTQNNRAFRERLFRAYMTGNHDVRVPPERFCEPKYVGCGEYNPAVPPNEHELANRAPGNEPNRRVVFFLFDRPPRSAPCQVGSTGPCQSECKKHPTERRNVLNQCAYYDRLAQECTSERGLWIDLQTVDELGFVVPNAGLILFPEDEPPRAIQTNAQGYHREWYVPAGNVRITLSDRTPVYYGRFGELVEAELHTDLAAATVTRIVIRGLVDAAALRAQREQEALYRPGENPPPLSRRARTRPEMTPAQLPVDPGPRPGSRPADGPESEPDQQQQRRAARNVVAVDNLALAAGYNGSEFNARDFMDLLREWLQDYYASGIARGYYVVGLSNSEMVVRDPGSGGGGTRFAVDRSFAGALGAYALFEDRENAAFYDMTFRRYVIQVDPVAEQNETGEENGPDAPSARGRGVPIHELAVDEEGFLEQQRSRRPKVEIAYRMFENAALHTLVARWGGAGVLEPYPGSAALRDRVHRRNLATVRTCGQAYRAYLDAYIDQVRRTGAAEAQRGDVGAAEDALRALGPPPEPYAFPQPPGIDSHRAIELYSTYSQSGASSFPAWRAITERIDELNNRHSEGAAWLRLQFKAAPRVNAVDTPAGQVSPIQAYSEVQLTYNFDIGSDGFRRIQEQSVVFGIQGGVPNRTRQRYAVGGGVEHETDLSSGAEKVTLKLNAGVIGVEASDDGTMKVSRSLPSGQEVSVQSNLSTGYNSINVQLLDIPNWGSISVSLCWRTNSQETLERVLSNGPGFFETRSMQQLLLQTQWSDLNWDERQRLTVLGWDGATWDRRFYLRTTDADFPAACRKSLNELTWEERRAVNHLRIGYDNWPQVWRQVATGRALPSAGG